MAESKTKENDQDVNAFIDALDNESRRNDCRTMLAMMEKITGEKAKMWGASIVGFGRYHYKYKSGREGDWMVTGFSPRKQNFTIYIMPGFSNYQSILNNIGKHKPSVSCLYVKKLDDLDLKLLEELIAESVAEMKELYSD